MVLALSDVQSGFLFWFITVGADRSCMHKHSFIYLHDFRHIQTAASPGVMGSYNRCIGFVLVICMDVTANLLYLLPNDNPGSTFAMGNLATR